MLGHPDVSAVDGDRVRQASVLPPGDGGGVDAGLASLRRELAIVLDVPAVSRRVRKVVSAGADEAHLFLALDVTALPFPTFYGLAFEDALPSEPPAVPDGLTHLWLVPRYARRLLLWAPKVWGQHQQPFD